MIQGINWPFSQILFEKKEENNGKWKAKSV